jgi:hypothetical protein
MPSCAEKKWGSTETERWPRHGRCERGGLQRGVGGSGRQRACAGAEAERERRKRSAGRDCSEPGKKCRSTPERRIYQLNESFTLLHVLNSR